MVRFFFLVGLVVSLMVGSSCTFATLLNHMVNVLVAHVLRVHDTLVGLFNFAGLPLVLENTTTFLSQCLLLLFLELPGLLLGMGVEKWLDLIVMMMELEFFLTHVRVPRPELSKLFIGISLLLINITLLLEQVLVVLVVAEVLLGGLVELMMLLALIT